MNGLLHLGHAFSLSKVRRRAARAGAAALTRAPADGRAAGGGAAGVCVRVPPAVRQARALPARLPLHGHAHQGVRGQAQPRAQHVRLPAAVPRGGRGGAPPVPQPPRAAVKGADRPRGARAATACPAGPAHAHHVLKWLSRTHATCRSHTHNGAEAHRPLLCVPLNGQRLASCHALRHGVHDCTCILPMTLQPAWSHACACMASSAAGGRGGGGGDGGVRRGTRPRQVLGQEEQGGREEGRGQHAVGHPGPQRHPGGRGTPVQVRAWPGAVRGAYRARPWLSVCFFCMRRCLLAAFLHPAQAVWPASTQAEQ